MSKLSRLVGAALIVAGAPVKANAAITEVFNWSGCGGASFGSCATVVANYDDVAKTLVFQVWNTNTTVGWPGSFARLGWKGLGGSLGTGHSAAGDGNWNFNGSIAPIGGATGFVANAPRPHNGLHAGDDATFTIKFVNPPSFSNFTFSLHEIGFGNTYWSDQGLNCATSNKLDVNKAGANYTVSAPGARVDAGCFPTDPGDPNTAVPEPATMILLASGLVGMAGMQYRRRKRTSK